MTSFLQGFEKGIIIGMKINATGLAFIVLGCMCFTGGGFFLAPMIVPTVLDAIWGK